MGDVIYEGSIVDSLAKQIDEKDRRIKELEEKVSGRDLVINGLNVQKNNLIRRLDELEAERDRMYDALQEITEQGRTGEDANVMAELAQEALED